MILDKTIKVKTAGKSIKYYRDLGYECGHNTEIEVKVEHLSKGSKVLINVACDYCGLHKKVNYDTYNNALKNQGTYACNKCKTKKSHNTNLKRYGVISPMMLDEYKKKAINTSIEKYGESYYAKTQECKDKTEKTVIEKYGVKTTLLDSEIQEKIKHTLIEKYGADRPWKSQDIKSKVDKTIQERYGVSNISMNKEIKEKKRQSSLVKYGTDYILQSPEIRRQIAKTLYSNQSQKASSQQLYLYNLYGGELNYPISNLSADICLADEKITIEYDGGGHSLCTVIGNMSQKEFKQKELVRDKIIKKAGYRQIRIISSKDKLPSDDILLKMLDEARNYFNTTSHTWMEYNIDTSTMRNAENKDGIHYDFGELRRIKKVS